MGKNIETVRVRDLKQLDSAGGTSAISHAKSRDRFAKGVQVQAADGSRAGHVYYDTHPDEPHVLVSWKSDSRDVLEYVPAAQLVLSEMSEARFEHFARVVACAIQP